MKFHSEKKHFSNVSSYLIHLCLNEMSHSEHTVLDLISAYGSK